LEHAVRNEDVIMCGLLCDVEGASAAQTKVSILERRDAPLFIDSGKGKGGSKWQGVAAIDGKVVFCPYNAAEVMVLDRPNNNKLLFIFLNTFERLEEER